MRCRHHGPYLDAEIVEERLSRPVIKPYSNLVFRHSESRIINIADPIGTATTLAQPAHFNRVVDFFLALILGTSRSGAAPWWLPARNSSIG